MVQFWGPAQLITKTIHVLCFILNFRCAGSLLKFLQMAVKLTSHKYVNSF